MKVSEYNTMVTDLWEALMGLEMQLVDQLEVRQTIIQIHLFVLFNTSLRN